MLSCVESCPPIHRSKLQTPLTQNVSIIRGKVFKEVLKSERGGEGGSQPYMRDVSVEAPKGLCAGWGHVATQQEGGLGETDPADTLTLDLLPLEMRENMFLLLTVPGLWDFPKATQAD